MDCPHTPVLGTVAQGPSDWSRFRQCCAQYLLYVTHVMCSHGPETGTFIPCHMAVLCLLGFSLVMVGDLLCLCSWVAHCTSCFRLTASGVWAGAPSLMGNWAGYCPAVEDAASCQLCRGSGTAHCTSCPSSVAPVDLWAHKIIWVRW